MQGNKGQGKYNADFFFFLMSGKYNTDFETTINLLINLRYPQECIDVIVPPRHINEFS